MGERKKRRFWKWAAGIAAAGLLLVVGLALYAWASFRSTPDWYKPVSIPADQLKRVRNSLPNTYQDFNEQLIQGRDFEFTLAARAVTEWITARAEMYPDARDWLPPWLHEPVVAFEGDRCIIGARLDREGWETVVGLHLVAEINEETVTIRAEELSAGGLPVPVARIAGPLGQLLQQADVEDAELPEVLKRAIQAAKEEDAIDVLTHGVTIRNLFESKNGRTMFKLRSAGAEGGVLRVEVDPQ